MPLLITSGLGSRLHFRSCGLGSIPAGLLYLIQSFGAGVAGLCDQRIGGFAQRLRDGASAPGEVGLHLVADCADILILDIRSPEGACDGRADRKAHDPQHEWLPFKRLGQRRFRTAERFFVWKLIAKLIAKSAEVLARKGDTLVEPVSD